MAEGLPPFALVKRVEKAIDNQGVDQCIFALSIILGRLIGHCFPAEHHEEVLQSAIDTLRAGIRGDITH